jgi:hypothetical protein
MAEMWKRILDEGYLPTDGEISQIEQIFGTKLALPFMSHAVRMSSSPFWRLFAEGWLELSGVSRGVKASFDHSNVLIQSALLTAAYPIKAMKAGVKSARAGYLETIGVAGSAIARRYSLKAALDTWSSERYGRAHDRYMNNGPKSEAWDRVGLDRIKLDATLSPDWTGRMQETHSRFWDLVRRAEPQNAAAWALLAPLRTVAAGIRASNRIFAVYSNELRTSVYEDVAEALPVKRYKDDPITVAERRLYTQLGEAIRGKDKARQREVRAEIKDLEDFERGGAIDNRKQLAQFLNATTGRSTSALGQMSSGRLPSAVFWSLRLQASRWESIYHQLPKAMFNPKTPWPIRKLALRQVLGAMALTLGTFAALKFLLEATDTDVHVETDPRSTDFLRIRIGDTVFNPLGGYQEPLRVLSQVITGQRKDFRTGKLEKTRARDVAVMWLRYKVEPVGSAIWTGLEDKNAVGEIETIPRHLRDLFAPISLENAIEAIQALGWPGAVWALPEQLGAGVQTRIMDVERQIDDLALWMRSKEEPGLLHPARFLMLKAGSGLTPEELQDSYEAQVGAFRSKWYDELFAAYADGDKSGMDEAAKALTRLGAIRKDARTSALGRKIIKKGAKLPSDIRYKFLLRRHSKAIPSNVKEFSAQYP